MATASKYVTRSFNIPADLLERMEKAAVEQDRKVNYLVRKCLEQCYPAPDQQPGQTDPTPGHAKAVPQE